MKFSARLVVLEQNYVSDRGILTSVKSSSFIYSFFNRKVEQTLFKPVVSSLDFDESILCSVLSVIRVYFFIVKKNWIHA